MRTAGGWLDLIRTARPIGPPPRTSTESPSLKGLISTACQATESGSTKAACREQRDNMQDCRMKRIYLQAPASRCLGAYTQPFEEPPHARKVHRPNLHWIRLQISEHKALSLTTQSNESILLAAVDGAFFAGYTCPVVDYGLHAYPLADFHIADLGSNLFDNAAELVAYRKWNLLVGDSVRGRGH